MLDCRSVLQISRRYSMSKRILVLSASVGAGHLRAAQAVELALRELDPTAHVENHDVMQFTGSRVSADVCDVLSRPGEPRSPRAGLLLRFDGPPAFAAAKDRSNASAGRKAEPAEISEVFAMRAVGCGRQHALSAGGNDCPSETQRGIHRAAIHGDHRFRNAPLVGQPAVRAILHGHLGRSRLSGSLGRAARND